MCVERPCAKDSIRSIPDAIGAQVHMKHILESQLVPAPEHRALDDGVARAARLEQLQQRQAQPRLAAREERRSDQTGELARARVLGRRRFD